MATPQELLEILGGSPKVQEAAQQVVQATQDTQEIADPKAVHDEAYHQKTRKARLSILDAVEKLASLAGDVKTDSGALRLMQSSSKGLKLLHDIVSECEGKRKSPSQVHLHSHRPTIGKEH